MAKTIWYYFREKVFSLTSHAYCHTRSYHFSWEKEGKKYVFSKHRKMRRESIILYSKPIHRNNAPQLYLSRCTFLSAIAYV